LIGGTPATIAARKVTTTIPIVAATFSDPIGFGLIESQARPGGNVTGLVNYIESLPGKLMALAIEVRPATKRIRLILTLATAHTQPEIYRRDANAGAEQLGATLVIAEVRAAQDLEPAIASLLRERVDMALFFQDALYLNERVRLAELAAAAGLPALYSFREHV